MPSRGMTADKALDELLTAGQTMTKTTIKADVPTTTHVTDWRRRHKADPGECPACDMARVVWQ